jgi:hypothetical protein
MYKGECVGRREHNKKVLLQRGILLITTCFGHQVAIIRFYKCEEKTKRYVTFVRGILPTMKCQRWSEISAPKFPSFANRGLSRRMVRSVSGYEGRNYSGQGHKGPVYKA